MTARNRLTALISLVILSALAAVSTHAVALNVLLGKPFVGSNGYTDFGANPPGALTDGNNGSGMYVSWYTAAYAQYDLGANYNVDTLGVFSQKFGERNHPKTIVLDVFTDSSFTTLVTTRTLTPLADQDYVLAPFPLVTAARYVRLTTPYQSEWTTTSDITFGWIGELQVFEEIPEPSTLALLACGGLGLLRRRR